MYTRILVPLDGSGLAEQVLPSVRALGSTLGAPIELLRTFRPAPEELADPAHGHYPHQIDASLREQCMDYLNRIKVSMFDLGVPVSCVVEEGDPATWIVDEAEKEPDTLIAVSTHGRSGITRWVLGSVTDKVFHAATVPLLVVRSREEAAPVKELELTSIIAPLDGSALSEQILPHVLALGRAVRVDAILVRVASRGEEAEARDYLQKIGEGLERQGVPSVNEVVLDNPPANAIIDITQNTPNSLVAMTTHGRSGVGRWVMGSVTDRVVRHCGDPVLVVRATEERLPWTDTILL